MDRATEPIPKSSSVIFSYSNGKNDLIYPEKQSLSIGYAVDLDRTLHRTTEPVPKSA